MRNLWEALLLNDIPTPNKNTETYKIIRWGKNNRYWLRKFQGGYIFGDFVRGLSAHVFDKTYKGKQLETVLKKMIQARKDAENKLSQVYENAAKKAENIWNATSEASDHAYLLKKKVLSYGLKNYKGCLVIPLRDVDGKLWSLQFINENHEKRFLSGGKKKGCFFLIGSLADNVFVCEGYATGATIYECTGEPVVVAFDAGNLKPIVEALHKKYPHLKMILCADNDCYGEINTGVEKAKEAAKSVGAKVVIPSFKDTSTQPTDFNDLKPAIHREQGSIPAGFSLSDEGLFYVSEKIDEPIKICDYISVTAFMKEVDGSIPRLIEFRDYRNNLCQTIITAKMFANAGDQAKVHLISKGFIMDWNSFEKKKLLQYLLMSIPAKEIQLVESTGYHGKSYVRPDKIIGENSSEIMLTPSAQDSAVITHGSLDEWIHNVSMYCVGNSRLMFSVSIGFASLLLKPCNVQSGGFHLAGTSSTGKTT